MSNQELHISKIPFGQKKLTKAKVMVYQLHSTFLKTASDWTDWHEKAGLFYPKNIPKFKERIFEALAKAEEQQVHLIVFPELSVPEELIIDITEWTKGKTVIVIAGSHYKAENETEKPIALCPVIFNGSVKGYTQKIQRAFAEKSAVPHSGLKGGNQINIYTETPIGDFAILICSDNLDEYDKVKVELKKIKLDFWIVPAFQKDSSHHFKRMTVDIESTSSRYIIYCNNKNEEADGKSSFFGKSYQKSLSEFINSGYTDNKPDGKLISLNDSTDYFIVTVDTEHKEEVRKKIVNTNLNIEVEFFDSLHEPKTNSTKKEKLLTNSTEEEKKIETALNEKQDEVKNDKVNSESNFKIFSKDFYKNCLNQFEDASSNIKFLNDRQLINPTVKSDIKSSLDENAISFITAPIKFGKSFFLNLLKSEFNEFDFITSFDGSHYKLNKNENNFLIDIYHFWFKKIATEMLLKKGISETELKPQKYIAQLNNVKEFKKWIESENPYGSNIYGFLKALDEFKNKIDFKSNSIILFNLDDIQKYVNSKVFLEMKEDFRKVKDDVIEDNLSLKLIIASRYLHADAASSKIVKILPCFEDKQVATLINFIEEVSNNEIAKELQENITYHTEGYPWFVIRFFKLYLKLRIDGNTEQPTGLAQHIFSHKSYWTKNKIFGGNGDSEFYQELIELINDSNYSFGDKQKFKQFIESDSDQLSLNDGNNNQNDYLLRQSGFMKLDDSESFVNNGNYIMKTHYKKDIQAMLP